MASYKKYAEDLIGDWETSQYEPQRAVTQSIYQTNMDKLSNDLSTLKDKLARNFANAQAEYANTLDTIQNQSFNRMRNANIDLANRGLSTSGIGDLATQADTQQKGQDIDKALSDLLDVNRASVEGLTSGVMKYGEGQSSLAGDLAGDLAGIGNKEAQNAQEYANLIAGIGQGAANRAASRAKSGGGVSKKGKKAQEEADELKRRMLIADTLSADNLTDQQKIGYLTTYLDVPADSAKNVVQAYENNIKLETSQSEINELQNNINNYNRYTDAWNKIYSSPIARTVAPVSSVMNRYVLNVPNAKRLNAEKQLRNIQNEISGLDYTDLYDLLYGNK